MRLKLQNIGIISKADIAFFGLTVIAGENDSGKSTVGKALYALIKTIKWSSNTHGSREKEESYKDKFNKYIEKLFNRQISNDGTIEFEYNDYDFSISISRNACKSFEFSNEYNNTEAKLNSPIFIDTPSIWNILPTLQTIKNIEKKIDLDFLVAELTNDLSEALMTKAGDIDKIKIDIKSIIRGEFEKDRLGNFVFKKDGDDIDLVNTAMGIKYFGILQVLSDNNHLYDGQILILDEPEVHLHPKWQLELAKVIVYLVSKGVKVVVNSHSPYMIEALQRYGKKQNIPANFYLANESIIVEDDQALSKIFAKLSEPFEEFDKMDSETLNG